MEFTGIHLEFETSARERVDAGSSGERAGLSWRVQATAERFSLSLHAEREAELHAVEAAFRFSFEPEDRLFLNGYQSWTDSREHTVRDRERGIGHLPAWLVRRYAFDSYGDYRFASYGKKPGQLHGFSYGYVRRDGEYLLLGSLAEESGFTQIRFDATANAITLRKDCRGHHFAGGYAAFDLAILRGGEAAVFDRYFALLGVPAPRAGRVFGYTSWYNRYQNITQASIEEDLRGFESLERRPDVFQIDDGYETAVGDWLLVDRRKFPAGMKEAAADIRRRGIAPGLWLAPFAAERKSRLAKEHPDWLLRDESDRPIPAGSNWSGFYALDIYNEEVKAYLRDVFGTVIGEWGFDFLKLDFLYAACVVPRRDRTRGQVMYEGMRLLRQLAKGARILGCGVPMAPAFGLVDYCRVGCDVSLSWDDVWYMRRMHRERVSTRNSILNSLYRRQLNGRAFWNDPDVFLLREENLRLTWEQKRILATVNALTGGVLFTSDDVSSYTDRADALFRQALALSPASLRRVELVKDRVRVTYEGPQGVQRLEIPLGRA